MHKGTTSLKLFGRQHHAGDQMPLSTRCSNKQTSLIV